MFCQYDVGFLDMFNDLVIQLCIVSSAADGPGKVYFLIHNAPPGISITHNQ